MSGSSQITSGGKFDISQAHLADALDYKMPNEVVAMKIQARTDAALATLTRDLGEV